jgi:hypothetical protein
VVVGWGFRRPAGEIPILVRRGRREAGEERRHGGADRLGQRRVAGAGERPQRGDQRHVRQLALAEVDAVAGQHQRAALGRAPLELGEQARLADAGLAGQEHDRRPLAAGVGERGLELGQLGGAPDQARARDPGSHLIKALARACECE